jgi:hypothetical protein
LNSSVATRQHHMACLRANVQQQYTSVATLYYALLHFGVFFSQEEKKNKTKSFITQLFWALLIYIGRPSMDPTVFCWLYPLCFRKSRENYILLFLVYIMAETTLLGFHYAIRVFESYLPPETLLCN